jgi:hypothetical protein
MESPNHAPDIQRGDADGEIGFIDTGGLAAGHDAFHCRTDGAPMATLSIYRNRLVIADRLPRRIYDFARSDVVRIVHEDLFGLSRIVRVVHTRTDYPPYIAFSPLNPDQTLEGFRRVGYLVEAN